MPNLEDYQTEHLFLLIGGNPLPNYVAAKLLAKNPNGKPTIHLIFSQGNGGTGKYAEKLRDVLDENNYDFKNLTVIPSRQFNIYNQVKDRMAQIIKNGVTSIGINYTGGTKAMAVHAHRAIKENCGNIDPVFSYLDSREMKMCIDQKSNANRVEFELYDSSQEYFKDTEIPLNNLLILHDLEKFGKTSNPNSNIRFPKLLEAIVTEFKSNYENWEKFRDKIISKYRTSENSRNEINTFEERLRDKKCSISELDALKTYFSQETLTENDELILGKLASPQSAEEFCKYIIGTWLEDFTLGEILEIKDEYDLKTENIGTSLEILHPNKSGFPFFEIDVVAVRGYQLFVVTCANSYDSNKSYYKGKLFEALSRAEQLGGSESMVALVCTATDNGINKEGETTNYVELLENELSKNDRKRVTIFGKEDILDKTRFTNKLREWFEKR